MKVIQCLLLLLLFTYYAVPVFALDVGIEKDVPYIVSDAHEDIITVPRISGQITKRMITQAFTESGDIWKEASPLSHVSQNIPPMLIIYGEKENIFIRENSKVFYQALNRKNAPVSIREIAKKNHLTIIKDITEPKDAARKAIIEFIKAKYPKL